MHPDKDVTLRLLREIKAITERLIALRERELEASRNRGFNPDDTTRTEED